jgi:hypothetical protein
VSKKVAQPTFQTRKLILETSFAIHDDFTNFDATRWPVTSTAYSRLVRTFYDHLTNNCNRLDILSSTTDDADVEVTIADIAAALKCHAECPQSKEQWVACPSTLTIEEIVDMCEGRYADQYQNATNKATLPPQL